MQANRCAIPFPPQLVVSSSRPTWQLGGSGTGPDGSANAVNGYFDKASADAAGVGFGSATTTGTDPWWYVDLGAALPVTTVEITTKPGVDIPVGQELH